MSYQLGDTIAAIASAPGGAARAIVRISGPDSLRVVQDIFEPALAATAPTAAIGRLAIDEFRSALPATAYVWPTAKSATREPLVELHVPGSAPVAQAVLQAVCRQGARAAEPGEFTLRAFLGGRIDLTQAEAVAGVIEADSDGQLAAALAQLAGGLATPLSRLRETLLELLAELEAGLDFAEEAIEFISRDALRTRLTGCAADLAAIAAQLTGRLDPRQGPRVVLTGLPNVGKSRLFNALAGREAALVADQSGTTRDYLKAPIDCGGISCELIDTAGIENLPGQSEALHRAAQTLGGQQIRQAQLILLCLDASRPLEDWEHRRLTSTDSRQLVVLTKTDLPNRVGVIEGAISTSAATGQGIPELRNAIVARLSARCDGTAVASTAQRCRDSVTAAGAALDNALILSTGSDNDDLIAAELRIAVGQIANVTGAVYTDDILDRIFSRFCIGK